MLHENNGPLTEPEVVATPLEAHTAEAREPATPAMADVETPVEAEAPAAKPPVAAIVVIALLALLPIGYLVFHKSPTQAAMQPPPAAQQQAAASNIPALEAAAQASPTTANRLNLSLAYIQAQQPGRAKPVLMQLIAADPKNQLAWNNLCVAHIMLSELKDAPTVCEHASSLDPSYQLAANNLKWALSVRQAEIDALNKMEQTSPGSRDKDFYLAEGMHLLHLGDYDKAISEWERILLMDSKSAVAANNIGTAYMLKNQPAEALTWFNKAEAWDPALGIAKNNIAWAQGEMGKAPAGR